MKSIHYCIAGALMLAFIGFAEPAKVRKADNMRAKPFIDAAVVLPLKAGQAVDIQKRQGSWYFVAVSGKTGWAPMLCIRRTQQAAAASSGSLTKTATGRSSTGGVVSTTGVRGLDEENLKTAAYSEGAVAVAEKHRIVRDSAIAFSAAGLLAAQKVPPLSAPAATGGAR
jgi:uncharacterized protein YgiM (DUF1202 family)